MVKIVINNVYSQISDLPIKATDELDHELSYFVQGYQYSRAFKIGYYDKKKGIFVHWDGKKHLLTRSLAFPTGLLARVERFLKQKKIEYELADQREQPKLNNPLEILKYKPRDYQQAAADAFFKKERGMLKLPTGAGKTFLAAMITAHYNLPTVIYVIGKDLLYQFYDTFKDVLPEQIGIVGDGKCDVQKITICSIWTAASAFDLKVKYDDEWSPEIISYNDSTKKKIRKMIEGARLAIMDEAHYAATETLQKIFKTSKKCRYFCGMSASNWRDDGADLLLESVCGPKIYSLPVKNLIERNFLVMPKILFYQVSPMKFPKSANYQTIYKNYIIENESRNYLIEQATRKLIAKGRKVLILVKNIKHGKIIQEMLGDISTFFVNGELDGEQRGVVKNKFVSGEYQCLIASSVFDQGVDIPELDALILGGSGKSSIRALQRIGRVVRTCDGKKDAIVVDFMDDAKFLDKHSFLRAAIYKQEGFVVKYPKGFDESNIKSNYKILKKMK